MNGQSFGPRRHVIVVFVLEYIYLHIINYYHKLILYLSLYKFFSSEVAI